MVLPIAKFKVLSGSSIAGFSHFLATSWCCSCLPCFQKLIYPHKPNDSFDSAILLIFLPHSFNVPSCVRHLRRTAAWLLRRLLGQRTWSQFEVTCCTLLCHYCAVSDGLTSFRADCTLHVFLHPFAMTLKRALLRTRIVFALCYRIWGLLKTMNRLAYEESFLCHDLNTPWMTRFVSNGGRPWPNYLLIVFDSYIVPSNAAHVRFCTMTWCMRCLMLFDVWG